MPSYSRVHHQISMVKRKITKPTRLLNALVMKVHSMVLSCGLSQRAIVRSRVGSQLKQMALSNVKYKNAL